MGSPRFADRRRTHCGENEHRSIPQSTGTRREILLGPTKCTGSKETYTYAGHDSLPHHRTRRVCAGHVKRIYADSAKGDRADDATGKTILRIPRELYLSGLVRFLRRRRGRGRCGHLWW
ncbi:hypothetical protein PYCCODRAFT_1437239 [Trametes coccinea BRFM310]|uniref:Uncharacterized protein n=1 Tax=Trametes coccinea (strain BRFM310) TaxID=1353009 RepID=A0A1Y2IK81_TRAC3|nr:hypothetical protein PYCCODRAFT_1437239 [Trametes coccinea BRFM310]